MVLEEKVKVVIQGSLLPLLSVKKSASSALHRRLNVCLGLLRKTAWSFTKVVADVFPS